MEELIKHAVRSEKSHDFFDVAPNGFTVAGPTPDGSLCVVFTDDTLDPPSLTLLLEKVDNPPGAGRVVEQEFSPAENIRVFRGRVRMTAAGALQLGQALVHHANEAIKIAAIESSKA